MRYLLMISLLFPATAMADEQRIGFVAGSTHGVVTAGRFPCCPLWMKSLMPQYLWEEQYSEPSTPTVGDVPIGHWASLPFTTGTAATTGNMFVMRAATTVGT